MIAKDQVNFVSGCFADYLSFLGVFSSLLMHPFDSIKAQKQFMNSSKINFRTIYRGIGIAGLFFSSLEKANQILPLPNGGMKDFIAGFIAQVASSVIAVPRDVVKQRLQIQHLQSSEHKIFQYNSAWDAIKHIVKSEGIFLGLYRGWLPDTGLWGVYGGIYYTLFTISKNQVRSNFSAYGNPENVLPPPIISTCALSSATCAAILTNPIDVLRLHYVTRPDLTMLELIETKTKDYGFSFWMSGYKQRALLSAPRTMIAFTLFEYFQSVLNRKTNE